MVKLAETGKVAKWRKNRAKAKAAAETKKKPEALPLISPYERALRKQSDARYQKMHPAKFAEEQKLRAMHQSMVKHFGHKVNGTAETHAEASRQRQGALMRLYQHGSIDNQQFGWAEEIAAEHARISADVTVRSGCLERVDHGRVGTEVFFESLGAVRRAWAYSRWRDALQLLVKDGTPAPILAMVVEDCGLVEVSRRFGMHHRRAKKLLIDALNLWPQLLADARRKVSDDDLLEIARRLA